MAHKKILSHFIGVKKAIYASTEKFFFW